MRNIKYINQFKKEINDFPQNAKDDIFKLVMDFLEGKRLPKTLFKTFSLQKNLKIQEFKIKDHTGNWRAVSCMIGKEDLTFVYAFHKKSQALLEKDKSTIIKRIKELKNENT
jgi:phage-related protein